MIDSRCFRRGILLELLTQEGKTATAEISPLPGYSKEHLDNALGQLQTIKRRLLTTWWTKQALYSLDGLGLFPSVYFGVESALLDLLDPLPTAPPCKSYALLLGSPEEILSRAEEIEKEGFTHAKVKIGHLSRSVAHEVIDSLASRFSLRLDLNRQWPFHETEAFCKKYPYEQFDYIEEPAADPSDILLFSYPFALDETLRESRTLTPYLNSPHLKALILKPTLLYPLRSYLNLEKKIVLTSSFEGATGIGQIKRLVHRLGLEETYHGLDTLRYLESHEHLPHRPFQQATP